MASPAGPCPSAPDGPPHPSFSRQGLMNPANVYSAGYSRQHLGARFMSEHLRQEMLQRVLLKQHQLSDEEKEKLGLPEARREEEAGVAAADCLGSASAMRALLPCRSFRTSIRWCPWRIPRWRMRRPLPASTSSPASTRPSARTTGRPTRSAASMGDRRVARWPDDSAAAALQGTPGERLPPPPFSTAFPPCSLLPSSCLGD